MRRLRALLAAGAAALAGCAGPSAHFERHLASDAPAVRECANWYRDLDARIASAGVGDAQYARVAGFPYLRVDRFHSSLRRRAAESQAALQTFAERLLHLELQARVHELRNLPPEGPEDRRRPGGEGVDPFARTVECARLLRELDMAKSDAAAAMLQASQVPDDYSLAARAIGLYPLTRLVFAAGVRRWEDATQAAFARAPRALEEAGGVRYAPPATPPVSRGTVAAMLARARLDPLGIPQLSAAELAQIAAAYAPTLEVEIEGRFDRFGALRWPGGEALREAALPEVDFGDAAVYVHPAYTRYADRVLLQLVYHFWLPERPAEGALDLLAGKLDGVVWRVTLAPDGEPLLYDSIHACGCYHMFFPTPRARPRAAPDAVDEWAFVPHRLPEVGEGERPVLRVASRTHYITRVWVERGGASLARYALRPYDELRSLAGAGPATRSVFGPDGIVAGSERAERFVFWPMGIASAGAMRQWGRHATAFVGRRHFDDADLLERRFELDVERAP